MNSEALKAEIARPAYLWLAVILALLVSTTAVVVFTSILPAREGVQTLEREREVLSGRRELAGQLGELGEEVSYWASVLPGIGTKLGWSGSASDFSGAILDAATVANVRLDKEINDVRSGETHEVYSKTLYFKAGYPAIEQFISELARLELLVVPGTLSLAPVGEGEDRLGVTLSLTGYAEIQP